MSAAPLTHAELVRKLSGMPASQMTFREQCILEIYCALLARGYGYDREKLANSAVMQADNLIEAIAR